MLAEILTIGDELCRGETVDTNAAWLATELWQREIEAGWQVTCGDRVDHMRRALADATSRSDLVICSGGLGPTDDDLTVDLLAAAAGVEAVVHEPSRARAEARFARLGVPVAANFWRQVRVPAGARVFDNPAGLAPGFELELHGVPVFALPGVPRELKAIFSAHLGERLDARRAARGDRRRIVRRWWRCFGKGESQLAAALEGLLPVDERAASVHYNVSFPETVVKLVVRDEDEAAARARLDAVGAEIAARLGDVVYGEGEDSLAAAVGRGLWARGLTLATAESCTGGLVGGLVTAVPGSSAYYRGGVIAYADQEKTRALGVPAALLAEHGAVSEPVVRAMAEGVRAALGTDIGVAVSGVAGPDGGTADKPVGTVWLAVAGPGRAVTTRKISWPGAREPVRVLSAHWALELVRRATMG